MEKEIKKNVRMVIKRGRYIRNWEEQDSEPRIEGWGLLFKGRWQYGD